MTSSLAEVCQYLCLMKTLALHRSAVEEPGSSERLKITPYLVELAQFSFDCGLRVGRI